MQAQILNQQISSKDKHQLAVETPLGWAIVGKPAKTTRPLQHQIEAYTEPKSSTSKNQSSTTADITQINHEDQQTSILHTAIDSNLPEPEVSMENNTTTIEVNSSSSPPSEEAANKYYICDGCGISPIKHIRYRCSECPEFDLCEICFYPGPKVRSHEHEDFYQLWAEPQPANAPEPLPSKPTHHRSIAQVLRTQQSNKPDESTKDTDQASEITAQASEITTQASEINEPNKEQDEERIMEYAGPKSILKKESQYGPLLEEEKTQTPNCKENYITNKPEVYHKTIHVFPAFSDREMAPEKLIEVMNSISMDNMTKGEHELQYVSHGRHELILHISHNEDF